MKTEPREERLVKVDGADARFIIEAGDLHYTYKIMSIAEDAGGEQDAVEIPAVKGVDLAVAPGSYVAVLGHNGSGKSTLAKLINALLLPSQGRMLVSGLDTSVDVNVWYVRQTAGMVFQNPDNQMVASVVEEDVAFGPENLGVPPQDIRGRVDEALGVVDMSAFAEHSIHFLSGGQKQRVAVAGVLAMKPQVIILDEPTAMLDPIGRREVLAALRRLNREAGMTVVLITHYMEEAVEAERIIVMDDGTVVMDDTPRKVFSQAEALRGLGLDVPQVTEIARRLKAKGLDIPDGVLTINELVEALCLLR